MILKEQTTTKNWSLGFEETQSNATVTSKMWNQHYFYFLVGFNFRPTVK